MKPQPRPRVTKSAQIDPAALPAMATHADNASNATATGNDGNTSTAVNAGNAGNASTTARQQAPSTKVTIRMSEDLAGRARSAWRLACSDPQASYPSFSSWLAQVIEEGVADVERTHNGGHQLTPTPAGQIPTGRPTL